MTQETIIENNYQDNVFFIAFIKVDEARILRRVIRATDMATQLNKVNLPEHFGVRLEHIQYIGIALACSQDKFAPNELYEKNIVSINKNIAATSAIDHFIIQGVAFDRFFTDAFYAHNYKAAREQLNEIFGGLTEPIILNCLHAVKIGHITFYENGWQYSGQVYTK